MATVKVSDLSALTSPDGAEELMVNDGGTSKKVTIINANKKLFSFLDANGNYIQTQKGGDIASASPTVIDTDGDYFVVTGTTSFTAMTVDADRQFTLQFAAILTMTHSDPALYLPSKTNITTAAGDVATFQSTAANQVQCICYTRADGTAVVAAGYSLPEATATVRGGLELFSNAAGTPAAESVSTTTDRTYGLQLNSDGQGVINVPWADTNTTYSAATSSALGLVKLEDDAEGTPAANTVSTTVGRTYGIQLNGDDQAVVNVPWTDTNTTYSAATASALGLIKLEDDTEQSIAATAVSATAARTYGLQLNSSNQGVMNVPWTDTNTEYTAGDGLDLGGTEFSVDLKSSGGLAIDTTELKLDLAQDQSWTGSQRATLVVDNDGNFDMDLGQNFKCTPAGGFTLTFTNFADGQSGYIILVNSGGHAVARHGDTIADANFVTTVSAAGTYIISYISDGTDAFLTNSAIMA